MENVNSMAAACLLYTSRIGTQGDSDDDYAVIRDTDMTSMIVEMGFMTNQDDLDYFNENLENYAKAISNGVVQWLNDYVQ